MNIIDVVLIIISIALLIMGIIGAIIPALPDVTLSFLGLVIYKFTVPCDISWLMIALCAIITAIAFAADYFIPAWGNKKFGGSKWGVIGCIAGLIIGSLITPGIGTILGCIIGAVILEIIINQKDLKSGLKSGFGAFLGYITSMVLSLTICLFFAFLFIQDAMIIFKTFSFD